MRRTFVALILASGLLAFLPGSAQPIWAIAAPNSDSRDVAPAKNAFEQFGMVIQLGLLIAALWLALETKALREKTSEQIEFEREWKRNMIAPHIGMSLITTAGRIQGINVSNESDNLVVNGVGFLFDCKKHAFLKNPGVLPYIPSRMSRPNHLDVSNELDVAALTREIHRQLPEIDIDDLRGKINAVMPGDEPLNIVAYIVHDVLRNPYVWFRTFELKEGGKIRFRASAFANHPILLKKVRTRILD